MIALTVPKSILRRRRTMNIPPIITPTEIRSVRIGPLRLISPLISPSAITHNSVLHMESSQCCAIGDLQLLIDIVQLNRNRSFLCEIGRASVRERGSQYG